MSDDKVKKCKCGIVIPRFKKLCDACQIEKEHALVTEYFADKGAYLLGEKKLAFGVALFVIFSSFVIAQAALSDYSKSCVLVNDDYSIMEPVYETINWPNATKEMRIKSYKETLVMRDKEVCNETVNIAGTPTDFKLKGYNCKNTTNTFYAMQGVFCDSCIDGNCDGTCQSGETCCLIKDGSVTCKNSVLAWNEPTKLLVVGALK